MIKKGKTLFDTDKVVKERVLFGTDKDTQELIYLYKPKFECGWYWSFGHLGNDDLHYRLSACRKKEKMVYDKEGQKRQLTESRNLSIHDALLQDYELAAAIKKELWLFCELSQSIYTLIDCAELFHHGGSYMVTNPQQDLLQDAELYKKLTFELIPEQCRALWELIGGVGND